MELQTRRRVGILIRIGIIVGTIVFVAGWMWSRVPKGPENLDFASAPAVEALGPGDLQIVSIDGSIDLILKGDKVMGGLSPAAVAKIRADMDKNQPKDGSGFGNMIAGVVKSSVASALEWHVTYPVEEITELRFRDGRLIVKTRAGGDREHDFGNIKTDNNKEPARFSQSDADRFVEAFLARRKEPGRK